MRVAFAGTPPFAAEALRAIVAAGHEVVLVLTQPDRPAGRGMKVAQSAVAETAAALGVRIEKPASLKTPESQALMRSAAPDVMVVAAYGLILPAPVLAIPGRGCVNIHASLLPRWRGAAPIHRAILSGDAETGITIMQMDAGLDTGPILLVREHPIGPRETTGSLTDALARLGAEAIIDALARLEELSPRPQDESRATYAAKITKAEARIDWQEPAIVIDRKVRAFNPAPGAEALLGDETLKIWSSQPAAGKGAPGEILEARDDRLLVACGEGALRIAELQKPGSRRMAAAEFLRGRALAAGLQLG